MSNRHICCLAILLMTVFLTSLTTPPAAAQTNPSNSLNMAAQRHIATTDNQPLAVDRLVYVALKNIVDQGKYKNIEEMLSKFF